MTSRIPGLYREAPETRLERVLESRGISAASERHLREGGGLTIALADRFSENVIAAHALPLSVALNFRVNHHDVLVPMSVEEPSVVAAASNGARIVRLMGGFFGEASEPVMTAQVQLDGVPPGAHDRFDPSALIAAANAAIPNMVRRGGGCRDVELRVLDEAEGWVVVHLYVHVGEAMGANIVDTVAEAVGPEVQRQLGGRLGLRILSNLPLRRRVRVTCRASIDALGGADIAEGIVRASRFAELDVFRAATHNKGIMNGIDAIAVALGQDWRSIEAGAHAFASLSGTYRPLATWALADDGVEGTLEMPLAVASVGGVTRAHPGVRAAFDLMGRPSASELAVVMGAAGLASNLAALRALVGEGIQRGHMRLHARKAESSSPERQAAHD